jgi:carboxyl-terminal processing protease
LFAFLGIVGIFVAASGVLALPEKETRLLINQAEEFERKAQWEEARQIYELLLGKTDPSFKVRERYDRVLRRCWQTRRHNDPSYLKEVLSVDFGQSLRIYNIISNTLLDGSIDKKKLNPNKLFSKGLEELDAALSDPNFLRQHVPADRHAHVAAFRTALKKTWGAMGPLTRERASEEIGKIALAAEIHLNVSGIVVTMEMACGACYAIDEYTVYLTPNQLRELAQTLSRTEAIGVGLVLTIRDNRIVIHDIVEGSPADRSKDPISANDQIISVNKKAVVDLRLHAVREMLEGPAGSMVEIEILTPGDTEVRSVVLMRQRPLVADVGFPILLPSPNSSVGVLKINYFTDTTIQDLDEAIAGLSASGMKGLILDLRGNHGGVFQSAIDSAHRFLSKGIITSVVNQDTNEKKFHYAKNMNALAIPLVVLVDGGTASAAEVLAGALKENDRAILVGQTTFGKGCTQRVLQLPKAFNDVPTGGMKLTVERFFSPKGISYSGRGIVPHFLVDDRDLASQANMMDPTLAKGIDELNRMLAMQK